MWLGEVIEQVPLRLRQRFNEFECGLSALQPRIFAMLLLRCDVAPDAFKDCVMVWAEANEIERVVGPSIVESYYMVEVAS